MRRLSSTNSNASTRAITERYATFDTDQAFVAGVDDIAPRPASCRATIALLGANAGPSNKFLRNVIRTSGDQQEYAESLKIGDQGTRSC